MDRAKAHARPAVLAGSALAGLAVLLAASLLASPPAQASRGRHAVRAATATMGKPPARAPEGPPLVGAQFPAGAPGMADESSSASPPSEGDALALNGFDSPSCRGGSLLPAQARRNCRTSKFIADPNPSGDYALDVNVDTGIAKWSNDAAAVIQNFTQLAWMGLLSLVHGLVVAFEWCYSLRLLGGELLVQAAAQLRAVEARFTEPLLALALALAAALAAYGGLVRRRVAQTFAEALATLAMIAGGLWLILDPLGTVGALQRFADEASTGTLAVAVAGSPDNSQSTLVGGLQRIFSISMRPAWCYLEFGDVDWCENPHRLDPRLRAAASRIAVRLRTQANCGGACASSSLTSAALLEGARTNGEVFLALPANKPRRNSVKTKGTLLNVLCGSGRSADACQGPTAAQAEFRSESGTDARVIGLMLIWLGGLGMLLLFGTLALRLLVAAVTAVLYLLLAPGVVLVPALGERGRALFCAWLARLLGAVASKLVYSFLLGVVLLVTTMLSHLQTLGWWAQWLLLSSFWWIAFLKRHQLFSQLARPAHVHVSVHRGTAAGAAAGLPYLAAALGRVATGAHHALGRHGIEMQRPVLRPPAPLVPPRPPEPVGEAVTRARAQAASQAQAEQARRREARAARQAHVEQMRPKSALYGDMRALRADQGQQPPRGPRRR